MMGEVTKLPSRLPTPAQIAEIKAQLSAPPLTRGDLLHGPLDEIRSIGPMVAAPGTQMADDLERAYLILSALIGPGRVELVVGLQAAVDILQRILDGVTR
jgi:hypothetical protein